MEQSEREKVSVGNKEVVMIWLELGLDIFNVMYKILKRLLKSFGNFSKIQMKVLKMLLYML